MQLSAPHYLHSLSSLARYYRKNLPGYSFELVEGSIVDIAKAYENIGYPGVDGIDAVVFDGDLEAFFSCADSVSSMPLHPLSAMNLLYDKSRNVYIDRTDSYKSLRTLQLGLEPSAAGRFTVVNALEAAALISCFGFKPSNELLEKLSTLRFDYPPEPMIQRIYLTAAVAGDNPGDGLKLLRTCGAVEALWPELNALIGLDQAKEFHPEGDVWEHSLETLSHRKTRDPELSLALLLHDLGKPLSESEEGNRFHNHAQIGRRAAERFLQRLEFSNEKITKISFLVENHMLPAAIKTLPTFRTEKAMQNPLFPLLLEVYRCDLMSSFNGPEGYYDACKVYRSFIKNTKNPFRGSDGKKLYRLYVD
ncbi:MAG: HD domain-containing protein [Spirochaetales bacterium]|uniref:HD domain-containing protein n=1 Tax=Candidatus Thalassospirochaeta sargassi TaxID=3119039 RepID=A0AAJ1IBE7_9SPIO|nr:HD domain-containing protein [Spirochaetales bacterium]